MTGIPIGRIQALAMGRDHRRDQNPPPSDRSRLENRRGDGCAKESARIWSRNHSKPSRADSFWHGGGRELGNEPASIRVHSAGGDFEVLDLFDDMLQRGDRTLRCRSLTSESSRIAAQLGRHRTRP